MFTPNIAQTRPFNIPAARSSDAKAVYNLLMTEPVALSSQNTSRDFLRAQLANAAGLPCDMPEKSDELGNWMERQALRTGERYAHYLASRKAGQPRRYFTCRSHALSFLQRVAPTKLVDGAWLYGVLQNWTDGRFYPLIRTYLEELGDGDPALNHVVLYQRLLKENGCEILPQLSDAHYMQGAIQLALGYNADEFTPELIGYNLGYEQLPLHLLITAFELTELQIDPYYFTLHVTIDNASSGHARKAVQSVLDAMPAAGEADVFLSRVANGYRLNDLGLSSTAVIEAFDLEQELVDMLERKRIYGQHVHSDFCRINGRTVNDWLAKPGQVRTFLQALEGKGWIKRHEDPKSSRFWNLIDGTNAKMFGVFSAFEQQLLHDWIAGDWFGEGVQPGVPLSARPTAFRPRSRRHMAAAVPSQPAAGDVDHDLAALSNELSLLPEEMRMQRLIKLMAPSTHASAAGLLATRLFSAALG